MGNTQHTLFLYFTFVLAVFTFLVVHQQAVVAAG
jgi:hypothetical protein